MNYKIFTVYGLIFLLFTSCYKERYIQEYGPPPNSIPYSIGQVVKFENGSNDTITYHCIRYQNVENILQGSCSTEEKHCTRIYHSYSLFVDLETSDHSRVFNLLSGANYVASYYWKDPSLGKFVFADYPSSSSAQWSDSIKLNGKTFYNYATIASLRKENSEPGEPWYSDTIRYSKKEGIIMFGTEKKSGNVILSNERWVLVK